MLSQVIVIALPPIIAGTSTYIALKSWIPIAYRFGLTGRDMNKAGNSIVAEAGGVWASVGASFGLITLAALKIYLEHARESLLELYALSLMLFMASFLGFVDDLMGWKKGLRIRYRVLLMAPLALPIVAIQAGVSEMALPFIGKKDLGLAYSLVLVPIGVIGASNAFNMVAGYNGLEASMGIVLLTYTALYSYFIGEANILLASIIGATSLIAFLLYNWYPAKVFPGNSLTYGFGAYYASLVILGNFEKFGVTQYALYFVELVLFFRGLFNRVYKENFGLVLSDGSLDPPYKKIYSLTHLAIVIQKKIRGKATERGVVAILLGSQFVVSSIAFALCILNVV